MVSFAIDVSRYAVTTGPSGLSGPSYSVLANTLGVQVTLLGWFWGVFWQFSEVRRVIEEGVGV